MSHEIGGWLWLVIDVLFVAALAAGMIYGTTMWCKWRPHPVETQERDRATREAFEER